MKYIGKLTLGLLFLASAFASCSDDKEATLPSGIVTDVEEVAVAPEGGLEKISVSARGAWVASSSHPWISISPANGIGAAECVLAIDSTLENTARTAQIRFSTENGDSKMIDVHQMGFGKQIIVKVSDEKLASSAIYDKRYFEATITTNVNFTIANSVDYTFEEEVLPEDRLDVESDRNNWITMPKQKDLEVNLDRKARPRTIKVRFKWGVNTSPYTRVANVHFIPIDAENDQLVDADGNPVQDVVMTVKQHAAQRIEDNRSGDSLAVLNINTKLASMIGIDASENMQNWEYVKLWEATDKNLPSKEAIGRVRSVTFLMFDLKDGETLPREFRYLKYLESLNIQSNANRQIREIKLGNDICRLKYLRNLTVFALGVVELPEDFVKLGGKVDDSYVGLEALSLAANNFKSISSVTNVVNEDNFPKLTALNLLGNRRNDVLTDLTQASGTSYNGRPLGLNVDITKNRTEKEALMSLLTWENMNELDLAYNFIEGELPSDAEMVEYLQQKGKKPYYTREDFFTEAELQADKSIYLNKLSLDTCQWLLSNNNPVEYNKIPVKGQEVPRVLPNARLFSINLNFLRGSLPNWALYHPYFVSWTPEILIFTQQERGLDHGGNAVNFDNVNYAKFDFGYYFGSSDPDKQQVVPGVAYPLYYYRYVSAN